MTRAKFKCESKEIFEYGIKVKLEAVMDGVEENRSFNHATPMGELQMFIDNEAAFDFFHPGKEYYLDFTQAE